jgi:hypothetical protein
VRLAAVLDGLTSSAAEKVGALETSWAGGVAAVILREAETYARHLGNCFSIEPVSFGIPMLTLLYYHDRHDEGRA